MKLLKKEVFDISKVTVVGSPTITSDGVLSNITTNDYINILPNIPTLSLSGNFEIKMKFTSPDLTRTQYDLISFNNFGFVIKITNNGSLLVYLSSDGTGWNESNGVGTTTSTIKPNTTYYFKFGYNGTNYYIDISTDNKTFTQVFNKVGKALNSPKVNFNLGKGTGDNALIGGSIDLASFSITRDGQLVYTTLKPTYLLERRKPKVWNKGQFTVVGNPSISESGIASGFSANSYITALVDTSNVVDDVTIYSRFTYTKVGKTVWAGQGNNFTPRIIVSPTGNIMLYAYDGSQTGSATIVYDKINFAENEMIYAKCVISNAERIISVSSDGINWVEAKNTVALNLDLKTRLQKLYFGCISSAEYFIDGQIDLTQFKIYTDNTLIFDGGAETYVYDPSKFTIVGSPTITEYGVLSNCSSNNIVQTSPINITNPNWEFNFVIDTNGMSGNVGVLGIPSIGFCYVTANVTTELFSIYLIQQWEGGGGVSIGSLPLNKKYQVVWGMNGITHYSKIKDFGATEWLREVTKTYETAKTTSSAISIGRDTANNLYLTNGSIDLPSISITVDGKEVFTGVKEKYYMFK